MHGCRQIHDAGNAGDAEDADAVMLAMQRMHIFL